MSRQETNRLLLESAAQVADAIGFHRLTHDRVAAEAGVNVRTAYLHFKTVNELKVVTSEHLAQNWQTYPRAYVEIKLQGNKQLAAKLAKVAHDG